MGIEDPVVVQRSNTTGFFQRTFRHRVGDPPYALETWRGCLTRALKVRSIQLPIPQSAGLPKDQT